VTLNDCLRTGLVRCKLRETDDPSLPKERRRWNHRADPAKWQGPLKRCCFQRCRNAHGTGAASPFLTATHYPPLKEGISTRQNVPCSGNNESTPVPVARARMGRTLQGTNVGFCSPPTAAAKFAWRLIEALYMRYPR
jgi:hypothetical protein